MIEAKLLKNIGKRILSPVAILRRFFALFRFDQDYQLEVYYERAPGELIHVYPLWREIALPSLGLSTDNDSVRFSPAWFENGSHGD